MVQTMVAMQVLEVDARVLRVRATRGTVPGTVLADVFATDEAREA
jgi:hypothetical protein